MALQLPVKIVLNIGRTKNAVRIGLLPGGGGGDSAYERGGDARRKFLIKPLKETDLGVA